MATKKQNKAHVKRSVRRALNRAMDFFTRAGGRRLNRIGYGCGLASKNMRSNERDDG